MGNFQWFQSGVVEGFWEVFGLGLVGFRKNFVVVFKVVIFFILDKVLLVSYQCLLVLQLLMDVGDLFCFLIRLYLINLCIVDFVVCWVSFRIEIVVIVYEVVFVWGGLLVELWGEYVMGVFGDNK